MTVSARVEHSAAVSGLFGRDMIYLGFWGAQIVLAAALTPVMTRLLGQPEYGLATACQALMQLLVTLFSFGLQTAVQRAHAGQGSDERARRLVTLGVALGLATGLVAYVTGRWWSPAIGLGPFPPPVRYAVLWAVMCAITYPALGLVRSRDQLRWFMASSFAASFFAQALALALVLAIQRTAAQYVLGQLLAQVLAACLALTATRPKLLSRMHAPMLFDALRFSTALVPALVAGFVAEASDRLVIQGDLGARLLSHYAVARNVGGFAAVLLTLLDFVWLPRLYAIKDAEGRRRVMGAGRDGLGVLVVLFVLVIALASPAILFLWAPASYHPRSLLLITALIAAAAIPIADGLIYTQALIIAGRTKAVAAATLISSGANLGLNLWLVPSVGIDGSAAISLGSYLLYALIVRRWAGAAGPRTTPRYLLVAFGGGAAAIASSAAPAIGVALGVRLLVAAVAVVVFLVALARLIDPGAAPGLRGLFGQLRALLVRA